MPSQVLPAGSLEEDDEEQVDACTDPSSPADRTTPCMASSVVPTDFNSLPEHLLEMIFEGLRGSNRRNVFAA
jgi:hypothetical protein